MARGQYVRKPKTQGMCEFPGCKEPAIAEGANFTVETRFFKTRVNLVDRRRCLCQEHLLLALHLKTVPELGRSPGEGIMYPRKAFCEVRKLSVSAAECSSCYKAGKHEKGFNHIGCQAAHLDPSPVEQLLEKIEVAERVAS